MITVRPALLTAVLSVGLWAATPLAGEAQPVLQDFRFDPPQLCLRDTFRWGVSYRGLPGGLAAVTAFEVWGRREGPGEPSIRSLVTPIQDDLRRYTADQGRFESRLLHWGAPRRSSAADHA